MNKKIRQQKSIFPRAFKRIIFFTHATGLLLLASGLSSCSGEELSVQQAKRLAQQGHTVALQAPVDSLVVYKSKREMAAFRKHRKVKTYIISLGAAPYGPKRQKGDNKTPEGLYRVDGKNAASSYHRNLGVSYPNAADRKYAREHRLDTGGDVKIHGLPNNPQYKREAYLYNDWTWGCIAVSNEEIEELYRFVAEGTPLVILP